MQLAKHAAALVIRLVVASLLLVLVRGLSAAASDGVTDVYSDSRQTIFSGYYTGTAITASGGQTQITKINDNLQLRYYNYPSFGEIPSNASPMEWDFFQAGWVGQKMFWLQDSPAAESQWAPNLGSLGRPVSCVATATSTIGLVVREGYDFVSIGYDSSLRPDIEFLPVVVSGSEYRVFGTNIQHTLNLGGQVSDMGRGWWGVDVPWNARLNLTSTPAVFAPTQGAAFGVLYDPLTRLPIVATPSYITGGVYSQTEVSLGTKPIWDEVYDPSNSFVVGTRTYSPTIELTGSLSPWKSTNTTLDSEDYGGVGSAVSGGSGGWTHVKVLSNRLTISSTTTYSDQPNYDRDVSFVDGRVAWTSEEEFSHIIHASNLSVSGSTLVVANSAALGEALLTSDSRAAYEVWLSTESWAVQNGGFHNSGNESIYLESAGGAKVRDGSILNQGLIRFRCPLATGSSTAFEPSRTLKVFGGAAILSGTQEGSGVIRADNGGFLEVRGEVTQASVSGFEGVAVTAGGLLSVPQLVTGELRVSGDSDLIVGNGGLSSSDIRVTNGGTLSVSGIVSSYGLTISGSASSVDCEALYSHSLLLEDGSSFLLRPSDYISTVQISDGATLTNYGGPDSVILLSALSISPGGTLRLNSFDDYAGMDRVGLRWSGGDHSAVLSGYLQDGRIGYRPGLGNVRAVYDVDSDSTLIIDPYAMNTFDVETDVEMHASGTTSIVGNTTVRKTGNGTLLLTGSNSYYAGTTVDAGRVVAGSVHAFGVGEVVVNGGTLDLASMPVANPTTIVSGSIANAENYQGYLTLAGSVSITGTVGGSVSVSENGQLKGSHTVFAGPVSIGFGGQHAPGNSPGTQTFVDGLSYAAGSTLNWELTANSAEGAGTTYDFLSVTGGSLVIDDGAIMNLAFSGSGSTVNWDNGFWDAEHSWIVIDALAAIDSTGTFTLGIIGDDSLGQSLLSVRPTAGFAIENTAESIVLSYSPVAVPEPSTYAMALAGLACGGYLMWRRRKDAA